MRALCVGAGLVLWLLVPALLAQPLPGGQVRLTVTVTDASRAYVQNLEQNDFVVSEDGVEQELTFFSKAPPPIDLVLLIDSSASMQRNLRVAQEAGAGLVKRLKPHDLAQIVGFASRVFVLQPFTNDAADLERAIRRTTASGSTSLYNAMWISLKDLARRPVATTGDDVREQVLVVLSDGKDTSSLRQRKDVLDVARGSRAKIYMIGAASNDRDLALVSGGRAMPLKDFKDLPELYRQISEELSNLYTLSYRYRNARRDGAWRKITVRVNQPKLTVRAREGYYGPGTLR